MELAESVFLLADLFMVVAGFTFGYKFIKHYKNYLLGFEWIIVATSGTNFLFWAALTPDDKESPLYHIAYFFDAFSRSFGITLILVLGLMQVTHRYKPSKATDIGAFALAGAAGLFIYLFGDELGVALKLFYVNVNVATTVFLVYFSIRLWKVGERNLAVGAAVATTAAFFVAQFYDFVVDHTVKTQETYFYIAALTSWGLQLTIYYFAYRALHNHNQTVDAREPSETTAARW